MPENTYTYVIAGGGLAGASAVQGIREVDKDGSILMVAAEKHLPYDRPPLSKMLWFGKMKVEDIFIQGQEFYDTNKVTLALGTKVIDLDPRNKTVTDDNGMCYKYEKLLLATGSSPRTMPIPGGEGSGVCYYRYLDDYLRIRPEAQEGKSAVVIGGGFIGSELAAALTINKLKVTMLFPSSYICSRVFPDYLGGAIQARYIERGVTVLSGETPVSVRRQGDRFITATSKGREIESDIAITGIGVQPNVELALKAGLKLGDGILVDEFLRTSSPDIYAAGDNAFFPSRALGHMLRIEHWDNSTNQGKSAGRNMAGAGEPFTYIPFFFSDLFEFGYEAAGDVDSNLSTFADWQKENDTGVIYYLSDGKVKGAMMCNLPDRIDAARELILKDRKVDPAGLKGAIT
jgi:3-phenylpropionate/trans-cinnamate dioxygenase ferredoxin reductase subunit